jgi:hypothetical protein
MLTPIDAAEKKGGQKPSQFEMILSSRRLIFVMLFAVTGFLGLPILWISPSFSRLEKYVWSVVNILYTSTLIAICLAICYWAWNRITAIS